MIQDFPSPQPVLSQGNKGCSCAPSWLSSSESLSTPAPLPVAGLQDPFSKWEISPPPSPQAKCLLGRCGFCFIVCKPQLLQPSLWQSSDGVQYLSQNISTWSSVSMDLYSRMSKQENSWMVKIHPEFTKGECDSVNPCLQSVWDILSVRI